MQRQVNQAEHLCFDLPRHRKRPPEHLAFDLYGQGIERHVRGLGMVSNDLCVELVLGVLLDGGDVVLVGFALVQAVQCG